MRDLAVTGVVLVLLLVSLRYHYVAPLTWAWLSLMNPHRLAFGWAYSLPFAQAAAIVMLLVFVLSHDRKGYPRTSTALLMVAFYLWTCITSLASFNDPTTVMDGWIKFTKVQVMIFLTMMMLRGRQHVDALVWVLVISLGFYGVKGGIHTIMRGGATMVMGPPGSFIEGTNHIALAMMMVVPLIYYLSQQVQQRWLRVGLWAVMALTMLSVLGTASRGALLAILTMSALLGLKSRRMLATMSVLVIALTVMLMFMPDHWIDKMGTISTHSDHSAQSRLYTWQMIWNLAMHNPITGGGFLVTENPVTWYRYAVTEWLRPYSPHSIYFQALAEHGFVGLALYAGLGISAWRTCSRIVRQANTPDTQWANLLARMVQASIAGFAVGGAFVNLVNFDLPYYIIAIAILTDLAVREQLANSATKNPADLAKLPAAPSTDAR